MKKKRVFYGAIVFSLLSVVGCQRTAIPLPSSGNSSGSNEGISENEMGKTPVPLAKNYLPIGILLEGGKMITLPQEEKGVWESPDHFYRVVYEQKPASAGTLPDSVGISVQVSSAAALERCGYQLHGVGDSPSSSQMIWSRVRKTSSQGYETLWTKSFGRFGEVPLLSGTKTIVLSPEVKRIDPSVVITDVVEMIDVALSYEEWEETVCAPGEDITSPYCSEERHFKIESSVRGWKVCPVVRKGGVIQKHIGSAESSDWLHQPFSLRLSYNNRKSEVKHYDPWRLHWGNIDLQGREEIPFTLMIEDSSVDWKSLQQGRLLARVKKEVKRLTPRFLPLSIEKGNAKVGKHLYQVSFFYGTGFDDQNKKVCTYEWEEE